MGFLSAFQKEPPSDRAQSVEKFSGFLIPFLERTARDGSLSERSITLIARAPSMAAARALMLHGAEIRRQQITVQIILAKLAPVEALVELSSVLRLVDPLHTASGKIRYIKNAALLDAHEQLVLGTSLCWTGDRIRLSVKERRIDLLVAEDELVRRRAATPPVAPPTPELGYARLYAQEILGADEGCDFGFLRPCPS